MVDGALDLLVMVLVLAVCVGIGFSTVVGMLNDEKMGFSIELEDKTAPTLIGDESLPAFNGSMSRNEVILTSIIQDINMPSPKRISTSTLTIEVGSTFRQDTLINALALHAVLVTHPVSARYVMVYNFGSPLVVGDESHRIQFAP